jgi:hypothetical protein
MKRVVILSAYFCLIAGSAVARPPPNADMSLAPWFQGLRQPGTGISCCSMADCRQTDFRIAGSHYQALVDNEWREVPPETVLERADNPTGRAVVCYTPTRGIMCFIRGPET